VAAMPLRWRWEEWRGPSLASRPCLGADDADLGFNSWGITTADRVVSSHGSSERWQLHSYSAATRSAPGRTMWSGAASASRRDLSGSSPSLALRLGAASSRPPSSNPLESLDGHRGWGVKKGVGRPRAYGDLGRREQRGARNRSPNARFAAAIRLTYARSMPTFIAVTLCQDTRSPGVATGGRTTAICGDASRRLHCLHRGAAGGLEIKRLRGLRDRGRRHTAPQAPRMIVGEPVRSSRPSARARQAPSCRAVANAHAW